MPSAQALVTVWLHVAPEHDEEFNAWYNTEHINQMIGLPGVVGARRYVCEEQKPKYLAWYDVADEHFDLAVRTDRMALPAVARLLELVGDEGVRAELDAMGFPE